MNWTIRSEGYDAEQITHNGNRFLIANGYLGIRGTLEEADKTSLPAINLAGVYDRVGDLWREPVNAPNALFTKVYAGGTACALPEREALSHVMTLDFRHGIRQRETTWDFMDGTLTLRAECFASRTDRHLICQKIELISSVPANILIETGIDGDVWDINGPHLTQMVFSFEKVSDLAERIICGTKTGEKGIEIAVLEAVSFTEDAADAVHFYEASEDTGRKLAVHRIGVTLAPGRPVSFTKQIVITTSEDPGARGKAESAAERAETSAEALAAVPYAELKNAHMRAWESVWEISEVVIEGDAEAEEAVNYSVYHLKSIAPGPKDARSIPARGLSGQTYKGAIFWDTEMFMLDLFLNTEPEVAKSLIRYRILTLPGAKRKAAEYGYKGAFYAWESQEGGFDACSDFNVTDVFTKRPMRTYFRDKQVHISAAVVYALARYLEMTGDDSLMTEGGAETIFECAKFYDSLLVKKVHGERYEIRDVIGPDEYHERVDNNAYTNRMAKFVFDTALQVLANLPEALPLPDAERIDWIARLMDDAEKLYVPQPSADGLIEQFDGYFTHEDVSVDTVRSRLIDPREYWGGAYGVASGTQVIKQADVVTQLVMFPRDFDSTVTMKNFDYYEPRTEHGSSLSACMYGIAACMTGRPEKALPFLLKSAKADLVPGGKEWAGGIYIGGTHPAAEGGAYMMITRGFAGLSVIGDRLQIAPALPEGWERLAFHVMFRGELYRVEVARGGGKIERVLD